MHDPSITLQKYFLTEPKSTVIKKFHQSAKKGNIKHKK